MGLNTFDGLIQLGSIGGIFFTSDTHFGHENIIKYCKRPFGNVEEMDAALISNWNEVVGPDDAVFHLGDFTMGRFTYAKSCFSQLNGHIYILKNVWHHDRYWLNGPIWTLSTGTEGSVNLLPPLAVLEVDPLPIVLCHYRLAIWDRKHYGAWHLHGHSHGEHSKHDRPPDEKYVLDVGVDNNNYYPFSLREIAERFSESTICQ